MIFEVLHCPFCGATAEKLDFKRLKGLYVHFSAKSSADTPHLRVVCLECGASAPSVEVWNRRVQRKFQRLVDKHAKKIKQLK